MKLTDHGVFLCGGVPQQTAPLTPDEGRRRTMAYRILQAHNPVSYTHLTLPTILLV